MELCWRRAALQRLRDFAAARPLFFEDALRLTCFGAVTRAGAAAERTRDVRVARARRGCCVPRPERTEPAVERALAPPEPTAFRFGLDFLRAMPVLVDAGRLRLGFASSPEKPG